MRWLARIVGGLKALLRQGREERDLDEELRAYLEASIDEKIRGGMSEETAIRAARLQMGALDAVKDATREVGWEARLDSLWRDMRYAARTLRKTPGFTVVAIATLALGIGANTAIFSAVNAILLRPLPVDHPEELLSLAAVRVDDPDPVFSYAAYRQFAAEGRDLVDALAASTSRRDAVTIDETPEPADIKYVSANYFRVLGVAPAIGRSLLPSDDQPPPGVPVALLSDAYWTRRFGRDPAVIGRHIRLGGTLLTIVGIGPKGFFGESVGEAPDLWLPLTARSGAPSYVWTGHSVTWLRILARRQPGVTIAEARARFDPLYRRIRDDMASAAPEFRKSILQSRLVVSDARGGASLLRDPLSGPLMVLMAVVGLVLLIACANVANLMLARAAIRQRETAVCMAFGASRLRVVRQFLLEAAILALGGGLAGLLLAYWGSSTLIRLVSGILPMTLSLDLAPDGFVLAFTMLVACATAVVFGLTPALGAARVDVLPVLKVSGGPGQRARVRLRRSLVVAQMALSVVLLVAASLFVRSLLKIKDIETGFDPDRVLLFEMAPADNKPLPARQLRAAYRDLLARAESVAGVHAASASFSPLLTQGTWGNSVTIEGLIPRPGVTPRTLANVITPKYFEVMRLAILRGRGFTDEDTDTSVKVAIVNQTFGRQYFGGANPVGRQVGFGAPATEMMKIVGVVQDATYVDLREDKRPMLYVPFTQRDGRLNELEVRTFAAPSTTASTLRRALSAVDTRFAIVRSMEFRDRVDASIVPERLIATLATTFGLLALALASVGLYGVIGYIAAQRTSEIGLRMALGANGRAVRWLVLRDTLMLVGTGLTIGVPLALAGARLLVTLLYQVAPTDPLALSASVGTLALAAILASYLPARRASRVDPVVALRCE